MEAKDYLVLIGIPSIKKYVFGTNKLMEIRGASALLADLNLTDMEDKLKNSAGLERVECNYVGGGTGQFIIHAGADQIESALQDLNQYFAEQTAGGLHLNWGLAELPAEDRFKEALKIANNKAQAQREENPFEACTLRHTGYIRECDSCSEMASQLHRSGGEDRWLCDVCLLKMDYNQWAKRGLWTPFEEYLTGKGASVKRAKTFSDIGELSSVRKDYTALVYADGNAMGKLIKQIETKEQFQRFSKAVDEAIRIACHDALYETYFIDKRPPSVMPAEILLLGGDDLLVYLTADGAFPFAIKAAEKFNEETRKRLSDDPFFEPKLEGRGLTISLGIAYGKSHTPVSLLLDQAEELLKSAKAKGSEDDRRDDFYAPTYIDYHLSTSFNQITVKDSRSTHQVLQETRPVRLYRKPYAIEDCKALLEEAQNLKSAGVPSTRLNRLGAAPALGKMNGTLECLKLFCNTRSKDQQSAIESALRRFDCMSDNIPWSKGAEENKHDDTVLVDLIELTGFCG